MTTTPRSRGRAVICGTLLAISSAAVVPSQAGATTSTPTTTAADAKFVSVLFGRAQFAPVVNCHPPVIPADAKTLSDVASIFQAKGWQGTPNTVVDYASRAACGSELYASWAQLKSLTNPDGWQPISATSSYPTDFSQLTATQVQAETCGSLASFEANGFSRAWGLLAYPSGRDSYNGGRGAGTGNAQTDIVHNCFAFGRAYGNGINVRSQVGWPWLVRARSPIGGSPADRGGSYQVPSAVISLLKRGVAPDRWFILQFYRFRSGVQPGDHNCVGPEQTHYTHLNEEYCWEDFLAIMNAIPADATVTDPATVACAWGRLPDAGPRPACPSATSTARQPQLRVE